MEPYSYQQFVRSMIPGEETFNRYHVRANTAVVRDRYQEHYRPANSVQWEQHQDQRRHQEHPGAVHRIIYHPSQQHLPPPHNGYQEQAWRGERDGGYREQQSRSADHRWRSCEDRGRDGIRIDDHSVQKKNWEEHPVEIRNGMVWRGGGHQNTRPPLVHRSSLKNGSREAFFLTTQGQPSPSSSEAESSPITAAWEYRNQHSSPYAHFSSPSSAESEAPTLRNFSHYDADGSVVPRDPRTIRPLNPHYQHYSRHSSHLPLPTPQDGGSDTPRDPRKRTQLSSSMYSASSSLQLHPSTPLPSRPSPPRHHVVPPPYSVSSAGSHSHHHHHYHHLTEESRPRYSANSSNTESVLHQQRRNLSRHHSQAAALPSAAMVRRDLHSPPVAAAGSVLASTTAVTCSLPYSLVAAAVSREYSAYHIPLARRGVQISSSSSKESASTVSSLGAHSISQSSSSTGIKTPRSQRSVVISERTTTSATKTNNIALEHSYAKSTHFLGQPLPPSMLSLGKDRSFLSKQVPESSKKLLCPEKQMPKVENLLVERVEHILVAETGAWPPSLCEFDLGMETESDSSCDSSFDTEEQHWMPLSLPVSFPHLLLQKKFTSSSGTSNRQASPATATTQPKLYMYATRKKTITDEPRQVKKREVRFATDDENSKPEVVNKCNGVGSDGDQPAIPISHRLRKRKAQSIESTIRKHQKQKAGTSINQQGPSTRRVSKRTGFKDFVPEVLETRSRAEQATLKRREEMEQQIEKNEQERIQTARPGDDDCLDSTISDMSSQDDSVSISQASTSSRDRESSIRSSMYDDFSTEVTERCKRLFATRNTSGSGDTPLHKVCRTGKYEMVRYFIVVEKISVNSQDHAGWTPLHEACNNGWIDIAELLLEFGANPNLAAADGTRPIHDSVESGCLELVELLVHHGADFSAEYGGKTPLELAHSLGHTDIVHHLEEIVSERRKRLQQRKTAATGTTATSPSKRLLRSEKYKAVDDQDTLDDEDTHFPVLGYSDQAMFGEELDHPLFFISATIELSDFPLLPVYNLTVDSRRHNFYLLNDLLPLCTLKKDQLLKHCGIKKTLNISVAEFQQQLRRNPLYKFTPIPLLSTESSARLEFIPLCKALRQFLDIDVANLDD